MLNADSYSRKGFTLVELMIVVAVCGVLVAIAISYLLPLVPSSAARTETATIAPALCKEFRAATDEDFKFNSWVGDSESISVASGGTVSGKGLVSSDGSKVSVNSPRGAMRCQYRAAQQDNMVVVVGRCDQDGDGGYLVAADFCNLSCGTTIFDPVASTMDIGLTSDQITAFIDPMFADTVSPCDIKKTLQAASYLKISKTRY